MKLSGKELRSKGNKDLKDDFKDAISIDLNLLSPRNEILINENSSLQKQLESFKTNEKQMGEKLDNLTMEHSTTKKTYEKQLSQMQAQI